MSEETERVSGAGSAPEGRFGLLWRRIADHRVAQWTVGYVAAAYALQHAVILTSESFEWPNIVARISMLLLVLGLPLAVTVAWYHGAKASSRISGPELTIISLLVVAVSILFYMFVKPAGEGNFSGKEASGIGRQTAAPPNGAISLAVLPFVNLSSDKEQEFFSDGMTEEITSALAKVQNLRVVARTSAFEFKGKNVDVEKIGAQLHATHLIEGSVRKDGDQVRITAQLIKTDDGTHLWTESYNRELKGVFAVQEEIATAIASALRVPLGLKQGESLVSNRTADTDSYQDYLRAKALVRGRGAVEPGGPLTQAVQLLDQVVAREPNYAPALALLGYAHILTINYSAALVNGSVEELRLFAADALKKGEAAAQMAVQLDPNNIDGYIVLAAIREDRGQFAAAEEYYKKAVALDPANPDAAHRYSGFLATLGRLKEAASARERLQAQEPFVPVFNLAHGMIYWENGRADEAIALFKSQPAAALSRILLAQAYASVARYSEAADALREIPAGTPPAVVVEEAVRVLRAAPSKAAAPQPAVSNGELGFVYVYAGAPDRVLEWYEHMADAGTPAVGFNNSLIWAPAYAAVHKTERFKAYVQKIGLVDYWRAKGWPDLCHPTTGDDFECG